jgi:hypothetical protein
MSQNAFVNLIQERLDWCAQTEHYETAARLRDLIIYETTNDEKFKQKYHLELIKKYASDIPGYYETIKKKYNL